MTLRSNIVDDLFLQSSITNIVDKQIFGIFNEFEDFLNSKANFGGFPAVIVKSNSHVKEKAINCAPLNFINESLEITALVQINPQNMKSRSDTVRTKERMRMRVLDTLTNELEDYFDSLTGIKGTSRILRSHLIDIAEVEVETDDNRKILGKDILIEITWQKVTTPNIWLDDGTGGISNPWNDNDIWEDFA